MQFWVRDESRIFVRLHFYSTQKAAGTDIVKKRPLEMQIHF